MTETSDLQGEHGARRRTLFTGAGAIGVAGFLAACGGETPQGGTNTSTPTGNAAPPPTGGASDVLAKKSDIPVGGGKIFGEQLVVVTQPTAGTFAGFSAMCTHQQCVLAKVEGGTINCGCHGSKFAISDGSVRNGPATTRLEKRELKIEGDDIKLA
ncbi:MAG TPA: Rieske (2Fe-2S) protein [Candidatus Limnocylindrales bacterium]|nr:Rieske (2Fe-2S) protein [Candidatus Limnocylindrales bacterium]